MNSLYGSEWRKWDFHVHTPYSILNNHFGINPFDETGNFDDYVVKLFTAAVDKGIAAIGITDYFMLEGYKRIRTEYLSNPAKMKACFPDDELRQKVEQIFVFPNIEFRNDKFVGKGASSVNYHVIFSDEIPIQEIEENFLHKLTIAGDYEMQRTLTLANIATTGKIIREENGDSGSDLLVGLNKVTVDPKQILDTLHANSVFSGQYLIVIPVDEDLSKIPWGGRDHMTRKSLYRQSHCYMTSNPNTRNFALAKGNEEAHKKEFGSIKPCIWGSDAHDYEHLFEPAGQRYCWVKADTTFDGLLQILYEPADRVMIQKEKPDMKDPHQVIDSITFADDRFQTAPIFFNENLTCLIGGKSTGKSLLLRQLAATIDPDHVNEREKGVSSRKGFVYPSATVRWRDGTEGTRKIVYIPQTFLNRTVDSSEESTEISQIIGKVLQQESDISSALANLLDTSRKINSRCKSAISKYCETIQELKDIKLLILREGHSATYSATIASLEAQRAELAEKTDISQEELDRYSELGKRIQMLSANSAAWNTELRNLKELQAPVVIVPGYFETPDGISVQSCFRHKFTRSAEILEKTVQEMTAQIQPVWNTVCDRLYKTLEQELNDIQNDQSAVAAEYGTLKTKVEQSEQLQRIALQIHQEQVRLTAALEREKQKVLLEAQAELLKSQIIASQQEYHVAYIQYCEIVKKTGTRKATSLEFDAQVVWKQKEFTNGIGNIFDNRNFSAFRNQRCYDLQALSETDYNTKFLENLWDAIDSQGFGSLTLKSSFTLESALQHIFRDWYNVHYIVKSGNDTVEQMSPGKKALVLLELLISLEDSRCPILIDQPEDDLDNRSIYYDLVQFIRRKKLDRQIIIVTHNANIVLGADSEEVIVANQDGQDTPNSSRRFEYRSGSIENDLVLLDKNNNPIPGILNNTGLQTQICDILEGGKTAFELRQHKYTIVTSPT